MYYDIANNKNCSNQVQGFSVLTGNGDPTSYIYYKRDGDNVTYKEWVPGPQGVADGHFSTKTDTVSRLINDYYVNQGQKDEVNGYVAKIKPEKEWLYQHNN
ncbi:hypothetical protein [Lactobacillus sp. Sy-1]|uniref:Lreu_0056 family protein n=1 Tax=Lactobacillus sp. Sy-1 TaxID=2109645 RepID=UPI001C5B4DFB|nr:hypothetical protein [Lactobacillus sp. Sy-1]MBW1606103.1 hypothetical protein [Lactobacillus sp. Sy-1]